MGTGCSYENIDDAKSVARVIDLYKVDKGITKKSCKASKTKQQHASVKTKGQLHQNQMRLISMISESEVAAMSIKEYEKRHG